MHVHVDRQSTELTMSLSLGMLNCPNVYQEEVNTFILFYKRAKDHKKDEKINVSVRKNV